MYKYILYFVLTLFLTISCKTISVNNEVLKITQKQVYPLSIGLQKGFNTTAIPLLNKPIRLLPSLNTFNTKTFKAFSEAAKKQQTSLNLTYVDSLPDKPKFLNLQVIDFVELANQLNSKHNHDVKAYMVNEPDASIVTNISVAFSAKNINKLNQADKVFLTQDGLKDFALQLFTNGQKTESIKFNQGVVFAYKKSHNCWQEDSKYQLQIVSFVDGLDGCPRKTYRSAERAKKKINYFKL